MSISRLLTRPLSRLCGRERRATRGLLVFVFLVQTGSGLGASPFRKPPEIGPSSAPPAFMGRLPLAFEADRTRSDGGGTFLSRGPGYLLRLSPSGAELWSGSGGGKNAVRRLGMQFRGSKPNPEMRGGGELNGRVNYFYGRDPENWATGRSLYQRVEYQNVYPGVEVVFYGNPQELEFDFVVQPGADPGQIRIGFDRPFRPGPNGSLVFETDSGRIELPLPVAYQEWGGVRQSVPVGYLHRGPGEVGLEVGTYDPQNVLVVDPLLLYSSFLGGAQSDSPTAIALDGEGNIYLVGWTEAGDFPATGGVQTGSVGGIDAFVTKLNPDATQIVYSTYLGGTLADQALDLAVAADGSVILTGLTASLDFPLVNPLQAAHGGGSDAFVARIAPSGSALDYSTFLGGLRDDVSNGVGLDESGSIYLSGTTRSGDFLLFRPSRKSSAKGEGMPL